MNKIIFIGISTIFVAFGAWIIAKKNEKRMIPAYEIPFGKR